MGKYKYSVSKRSVLCTFNLSFCDYDAKTLKKMFRFVALCTDKEEGNPDREKTVMVHWVEGKIRKNKNKDTDQGEGGYYVKLKKSMEYGKVLAIESSLWSNDRDFHSEPIKLPFTTQRQNVFCNALTDDQYFVLISGFWRKWYPENEGVFGLSILGEIMALCFSFFDHPFEVTMRWTLNQNSDSLIEQQTIRLYDAKDINLQCLSLGKCKDRIKSMFLTAFEMGEVERDNEDTPEVWKSEIDVGSPSEHLVEYKFPKTIDIQMAFSKIACLDVEYERRVYRVAFVRKQCDLLYVKNMILKKIGVSKDIHLFVGDYIVSSPDDMKKYLFCDEKIVSCRVYVV